MSGALSGRVALITGAGAGIGEGIARRFADEGAKVVVAELDESSGRAVAERVGGLYVATDVADRAQVDAAVAATVSEFGSIDILVNNAWGGGGIGRVESKSDEQISSGIAVGYYGPFWAMRAAHPHRSPRVGADGSDGQRGMPGRQEPGVLPRPRRSSRTRGDGGLG